MKLIYFAVLLLFCSCTFKCSENQDELISRNGKWDRINIETDSQQITFFQDTLIAYYEKYRFRHDTLDNGTVEFTPINKMTTQFMLSKEERDSLYQYVYELIRNPIKPPYYCTDYVGNATFKISSGQVAISCNYSSICSFEKLGHQAMRIKAILTKRIEFK